MKHHALSATFGSSVSQKCQNALKLTYSNLEFCHVKREGEGRGEEEKGRE